MSETEEKLFNENQKLAYFTASKFNTNLIDKDELEQLALIGLWNACRTYKKELGYKFSTYATNCCKNEIIVELNKLKRQIHFVESDFILVNEDEEEDMPEELFSVDEKIEENIECREIMEKATKIICKKHAELLLIFTGEKTQTEIAKEFGVDRRNINGLVMPIRKKLKKVLDLEM